MRPFRWTGAGTRLSGSSLPSRAKGQQRWRQPPLLARSAGHPSVPLPAPQAAHIAAAHRSLAFADAGVGPPMEDAAAAAPSSATSAASAADSDGPGPGWPSAPLSSAVGVMEGPAGFEGWACGRLCGRRVTRKHATFGEGHGQRRSKGPRPPSCQLCKAPAKAHPKWPAG
jgi:hypothetical protein